MQFGSVCSGKSRTGRPAIDLLGQRFGRLLVVERVENDKRVDRPPNTLEQDMQKQCTKCGETKLLPDAFHLSSKSSDGHASWCKACVNSIRRENRKRTYTTENKQKWAIKTRYGLTPSDVQAMLEKQGGACAICVLPLTKHHIDHCHTTGKVRGLLCHRCNTRLGGLDDKQWRDAALRYLGLQA